MTTQPDTRMPILYLSHGAPPLADDDRWTAELAGWSEHLPAPRNVLMISAHWENAPLSLSATRTPQPLVYDFWGFPQKYYEVTYDAPQTPGLADEVEALVDGWCWGHAYREISGSTTLSNHASGTAIDINAPRHPLGASGTFSSTQVSRIRSILSWSFIVLGWACS